MENDEKRELFSLRPAELRVTGDDGEQKMVRLPESPILFRVSEGLSAVAESLYL